MTFRKAHCVALFLLAAIVPAAHAATVQWTNTSGGSWSVGSNWSGGTVPASGDDVVITTSGTYTVTLNVSATVNSLTIGGGVGTQTLANSSQALTLTNGGNINTNGVLSMTGGTLTVGGTLTNNGTFDWIGGAVSGAGAITNNNALNITGGAVKSWTQATLNNNQNVVSSGTGYIYFYTSPIVNNNAGATWTVQNDAGYYIATGTPVFNNAGTLTKSAGTGTKDFQFVLNNTGQVNVQTGTLRVSSGGTSSGPFAVSSGAVLQFNGGTHTLNAGANVTGTGSVSVNSGTVTVAGTYDITTATTIAGGTLTVTGTVNSLGTLTASSGTLNLNTNSTITALGAVTISGGTLNLNSTASFTMTGLTLSSGTFGGTSAVTITGAFDWSGGTVNRTGTVTLPSGSAFNITGTSTKYWYSATLDHSGTATTSGTGYIYFYNSPVFNNFAGATWSIQGDAGYYIGSGTPVFNNSGTLTKSVGTGVKDFYFVLNNNNQVNVQSGTLRVANGGTSSGPFTVSAGASLIFYGGTHTLNAGATVTGAGSVGINSGTATIAGTYDIATATTITGGTLTLNGTINSLGTLTASNGTFNLNSNSTITALGAVTVSGGTLNLNSTAAFTMTAFTFSSGTFGGTSAVTITGTFAWSGGTVNRTGAITLPSGSTFPVTGPSVKYWYSATLNHSGSATTSGTGYIYFYNSPVFNNFSGATWSIEGDAGYYIGSGTPVFNNAGTVTKSIGTGIKDFQFQFNNTGQLNVNSGTLRLANGGTSSAPYTVASGATLAFYGGTHTLNAGATLTGTGSVAVTSGTVFVADTYSISTATTINGGTLTLTGNVIALGTLTASNGTFNLNTNSTITALGAVTISGGTLNLNSTAAFTMTDLTFSSGTFGGTSAVTISGTFAWSGGTVNRTGSVTLPSGSFFNISGAPTKYWYSATLNNSGTATSSGTGYIYFYNSPIFNNLAGALWSIQGDAGYYIGSGTPVFNNSGTVIKSVGTGNKDFYLTFNNDGTLNVQTGTLRPAGGGTSSGAYNVSSGAALQFSGGTHTLNGSASIAGAGSTQFTSGTVTLAGTYNITGGTTVNGGAFTLNGILTATGPLTISNSTFTLDTAAAYSLTSLTLSGGTLGGTAPITVTSTFNWSAGSINRSGSLTLTAACTTTISGASTKYLYQVTINNSGTVNSTTTGYIYLYNGTVFNNLAGANYNIQSDSGYYYGTGAVAQFNNSGTLTKSAGAGVKEFYFAVNNTNQLNVQSGTLRLANGGTSTGAYNVSGGAILQFYGGTHTLSGAASIAGAGALQATAGTVNLAGDYNVTGGTTVNGGTLNLTGTLTAAGAISLTSGTFDISVAGSPSLGTVTMSSGTLGGSSPLTITTFNWSGGTVNRPGAVNIPAVTGSMTLTGGSTKYWQQATLNNSGTVASSSTSYLYIYNGAILNNLAGASWTMTTDLGYYHGGGAMPQINNAGTMSKTTATGIKDINVIFNNTGQVNVNSGTLRLTAGGTSSGTFTVAGGAVLRFDGGTHTLSASSTLNGAGTIDFNSGTINFAGTYGATGTLTSSGATFNYNTAAATAIPTFNLTSGTLGGTTALTITTFNWTGGTVNRSGAVNIPASTGTMNLTGGGGKYWYQATLNNSGTVNSASTYYLYFYDGAVINNLSGASWNMQTDLGYYHGGGTMPQFNNAGTMTKTAGAGSKDFSIPFNNTGQVNVNSGTLRITAGGTSSGTFTAAGGTTLRFDGGTQNLGSSTLTGAGNVDFASGTINFTGTYSVTGNTSLTGSILNFDTAGAVSLPNLTMSSGTLGGVTTLTINTFNWSGGTVNRSGAVNIPASTGTMNITGGSGKYWYQATLNNSGTVTSSSTYYLYFYNAAVINNLSGATWNMTTDLGYYHGGGAASQFNNAGTLSKTAGTGSKDLELIFSNTGQLNVNNGTLRLYGGGGTGSGVYAIASGSTLRIAGATYTLGAASSLTGAGAVDVAAGTLTFSGTYALTGALSVSGGTLNVDTAGTVAIPLLNLSSGNLGGSATLTITAFNWTGGQVNRSGNVDIPAAGGALTITNNTTKYWYQATLNNSGTVTSSSAYYLYLYNGAIWNNLAGATWNMTTDFGYYFGGGATPQINNAGTMSKTAGAGAKEITVPFNNTGQLNVNSGTIRFTNGGGGPGAYAIASGATLRFDGGTQTLTAPASISGAGTFDAGNGTTTHAGTYNVTGATTITGGTLTLSGTISAISPLNISAGQINLNAASPLTIASLSMSNGTLGGTTALTVTTFNWSGGIVNRSGSLAIPVGGTISLTGSSPRYWYQSVLNNAGTITSFMTGSLSFYNGAVVNNLGTGTIDLQSNGGWFYGGGTMPQLNNSGSLTKSAGTATQAFGLQTSNSGAIELQTGILQFNSGFTQTSSGSLEITISGLTAGTQYARAAISSGSTILGGALNIALNAFTPTVGDTFQILTFPSRSGDFATKSGLTYGGGSMSYAANATNITLTGATATADMQLVKTASAATVATGNTFTFSLDAENLGPSAAQNVTVSDTLPAGVSLNSAAGTGWTCNSDGATPPTVTCTMATLAVGTANTIVLNVTAPASPQSITNTGTVTTSVGDPASANDSSSVGVSIVSPTPGITVTSSGDSGAGTLRQAIDDANAAICSAPCTIGFNLSPLQPIVLSSALPAITADLIIDGTTQPGWSGAPLIELDAGTCGCGIGLEVLSTNSIIRGVAVRGFSVKGVRLGGGGGHTLELSTIGSLASPNGIGVSADSNTNLVQNNTIAYSTNAGVIVSGTAGVRILGNAIHDSGGIGIDLDNDGPSPNDTGDPDTGGANNLQNAPAISAAQSSSGTLNVTLSVDSINVGGTGSIRVEVFEADPSGEGKEYLGGACFAGNTLSGQLVTVGSGNIVNGDSVVATATSYTGTGCLTVNDGTSEFSASFPVTTCTPPSAAITAPSSVCAGTSGHAASVPFVLGATYIWSITNGTINSGGTTDSITFTPGPSGTVELQVTVDDQGCTTNGTANIAINTATTPAITPDGPTTFCAGQDVILSASNGSSFLWAPGGETTQSITVTAAGDYSVTVVDGNGCSATSAATTVTVNPSPSVTITGPAASCESATIQLDAGPGHTTYAWLPGGENTQIINVSPIAATTYTVTVTNAAGCTATDTHDVTVNSSPMPTITASGPTNFCAGSSVTFTASAGDSFQWYKDAAILPAETSVAINVTTAGSYHVVVTSGGCSGTSAPVVTSVNTPATPTITPSGATTFCAGGNVTLNASAGNAWQWERDNVPVNGATASSFLADITGSYTVAVTDANGCVATSTPAAVTVNPNPIVTIVGPAATCPGSPVTLDGGAGFASYAWSTLETTRFINVTPAANTTYSVTITDANGCTASDSHDVNISANPTATITAPASTCAGSPGNSASVASQPGAVYTWTIANGTITAGAGTNAITFTAGSSGNVGLDVTVAVGSCTSSGSTTVAINTPPSTTITGPAAICAGGNASLDAGPGFATYLWSNGETTRVINVSPASTTTYNVVVTDANTCSATASHEVTVNPLPVVTITGPNATCPATPISLDAGAGYSSYLWSTGETTRVISVSPAVDTTYSVTVSDGNNCSAGDSHTVTIAATPTAAIAAPPSVCASSTGNQASVAAQAGAGYVWTITGGAITAGQGTEAITFSADPSGSIVLGVTVTAGTCSSTGSTTVPITTPPNVVITGPTTACAATPINLDAGAGYATYLWSTGDTTRTITVSPGAPTTYSVTVTDASGCSGSDTHSVTTAAAADSTITAPAAVDAGTPYTASVPAQAGAAYSWSISNGAITSAANANSITFTSGASGNVSLTAEVTSGACASSSTVTIPINAAPPPLSANLAVAKSAPASVETSAPLAYTIDVSNSGPGTATATITDTLPAGVTLVSVSSPLWNCAFSTTTVTCNGGLAAGAATSIVLNTTAPPDAGTITNTVAITSSSVSDADPSNNSASATTVVNAPPPVCETTPPSLVTPANGATVTSPVTFSWTAVNGANVYELWITNNGSLALAGTTANTTLSTPVPSGSSTWHVVAQLGGGCDPLVSVQRAFTIQEGGTCNTNGAPQVTAPAANASTTSPVSFSWTAVPQAIGYRVFIEVNGSAAEDIGTTDGALSLIAAVPAGTIGVFVDAIFGGCPPTRSQTVTFEVTQPDPCATRTAATLVAPANNATLQTSRVQFRWNAAAGATSYRVWASIDGAASSLLGTTSETSLDATIEHGEVIWWAESLYDGCASTESARSRFVIPERQNCGTERPTTVFPAGDSVVTNANVAFLWNAVEGAIGYEVWLAASNGAPTLIGTTAANVTTLTRTVSPGELEWTVIALVDRCPSRESQKARFTYAPPAACVDNERPILVSPLDGVDSTSPVNFEWNGPVTATRYELYVVRGTNAPSLIASTQNESVQNVSLATGALTWFVRAYFGESCSPLDSAEQELTVIPTPPACGDLDAPSVSAPGEISSGVPFLIQWAPVAGATSYQLQIASNSEFDDAEDIATTGTSHEISRTNNGPTPLAVFARVRAIDGRCTPLPAIGFYGPTSAIFILPAQGTLGTVPLGEDAIVTYTIVLGPELAGQTFTAVPTQPWLSVSPASGVVAPGGTTLTVQATTEDLGVGTNTGAIAINLSGPTLSSNATSVSTPISVNLVTPVTPSPKNTPPPDAMIIPAVANAAGINAQFQSDVRVSNTSPQLIKYQLTFIPTGDAGISAGRQTTFSIEPGRTVALDDVLKSWFGTGTGNAVGSLEIRPLTKTQTSTSSAAVGALANIVSFASSRTFNVTPTGTFGQYIPAVPFANFLGKAANAASKNVLSLQQISQSDKFRTNLGLVEGSGEKAELLVKVFGSSGQQLTSFPVTLNGGQHTQLNAFLFQKGITLNDGRVEVEVVSGSGKITAYASVLDNATSDAVLVTPVTLSDTGNTKWVVPGVADIATGFANWKTDMRVFNAGAETADLIATFYSQNGGAPKTAQLSIPPGEVRQLDKILPTLFNVTSDGGAVHLESAKSARLIATARTYNETSTGSYGLFASAVTPQEAVGVGSRPLQLLQVEESSRYRSNIGFAEVTGKPVKLEVTVIPPDVKFAAIVEVDLAANEFRQIGALLSGLGLGTEVYNARISVRAVSGDGRATAYAAVIDMKTNDPTYVPAQ